MQSVVYGTYVPDDGRLATRLDFDEAFGTAVNRFCCQAVAGYSLTQYGSGTQRRGFLSLADSMQCLTLAIENPPSAGEYRVFNQLREVLTIAELADRVRDAAVSLGFEVLIGPIQNPRSEEEGHYYNPDSEHLRALGFVPAESIESVLKRMIKDLMPHRARIQSMAHLFAPTVFWKHEAGKESQSILTHS